MNRSAPLLVVTALLSACATVPPAKVGTEVEELRGLVREGKFEVAIKKLSQRVATHPDDLEAWRALAEAHVKAGSAADWLTSLQRETRPVADYARGLVHFAATETAGTVAIADFQRAVAAAPRVAEYQHRLGVALLELERYAEARAALERAVADAPNETTWQLPLAKARQRTGDRKGATAALKAFIRSDARAGDVARARDLMAQLNDPFAGVPSSARAKLDEAFTWLHDKQVPQQGLVALEELAHDFPDLAVVHTLLGLAFRQLDDVGRAVEELKRAIELAPETADNHLYLAEIYLSRQRKDAAREHLVRAIELNPYLGEAQASLGDMLLDAMDYAPAMEAFRIASLLDPGATAPLGKLALAQQLSGDFAAADKTLRGVLETHPTDVEFTLRLGLLYIDRSVKAGRVADKSSAREEAQKHLRRVLELDPENAIASRALEGLQAR